LSAIGVFYVLLTVVSTKKHLLHLGTALCLGMTVVAVYGLAQFYLGSYGPLYSLFSPFYTDAFVTRGRIAVVGTFANPNTLACFGVPVLSVVIAKIAMHRSWKRIGWMIASVLIAACLVLTMSKNAWLQIGIVISLWILAKLPLIYTFVLGLLSGFICSIALFWTNTIAELLGSIFPRDYELSIAPRIELWEASLRAFIGRPLQGYGLDTFAVATASFRTQNTIHLNSPHNVYLQTLNDIGLIGFSLLYGFIFLVIVTGLSTYRRSSGTDRNFILGLVISCATLLVGGLSDAPINSNAYMTLQWIIFGLLLAASNLENGVVIRSPSEQGLGTPPRQGGTLRRT
jgi:putative inorganic carbon (hco3(-)) transporter